MVNEKPKKSTRFPLSEFCERPFGESEMLGPAQPAHMVERVLILRENPKNPTSLFIGTKAIKNN